MTVAAYPVNRRSWELAAFVAGCAAVYTASFGVLAYSEHRRVLEVAVTLDLTVLVPALYWGLLVRGRGWPRSSVVAVFILSVVAASALLPSDRQSVLSWIEYAAVPAELMLVGVLVHRARKAARMARASGETDTLERFEEAAHGVIPSRRAALMAAYEAAVLWHAALSWRARPATESQTSFGYHRRTGYGAVVAALMLVILMEAIPVHLLASKASVPFAWFLTALSAYGAIWLIGDYRAMQLRPITVSSGSLHIRFGLRWTLAIPLAAIEEMRAIGAPAQTNADLRLALPGARRVLITLSRPVQAKGLYGITREVRRVEVGVDDPLRLIDAIAPTSAS